MFKSKSSKQTKRPKGGGGAAMMQQMGFQIPNFDEPEIDADDDDDEDLEAQLKILQQDTGGPVSKRPKANQQKPGGSNQDLQAFHSDVNKLLSDIDRPINDDELSDGDEEDLLAELHEIADDIETENHDEHSEPKQVPLTSNSNMLSILEARREMYIKAVETAKTSGDAGKARRLDRQLKSIQELLQSARTGAPINESDIPPSLFVAAPSSAQPTIVSQQQSVRASSPPPPQPRTASLLTDDISTASRPSASIPTSNNNSNEEIERLKTLALKARADGDMAKAKEYLLRMKALQSGATVTSAPPPPAASIQNETPDNAPEDDNSPAPPMPLKAPEPRTIMEALQQRHEELTKRHQEAISKGESSKIRRLDRLTKQYQEAMDATRKGRPYDYSELPDLPGFAPIPVQPTKPQLPPPSATPTVTTTVVSTKPVQVRPSQPQQPRSVPPAGPIPQATTIASTNTRKDQQIQTLRLKQEKFQKLALQARQQGDIETAKKHLIAYKGLEQMITAAESGVSIDMNQVPELPNDDYEMIRDDELTEEIAQSDRDTIYQRLQEDLLRQMQLCARNQQMYAQMEGSNNIKQANDFKILEQRCAHDLEQLRKCFQHGAKAPLFHYEKRQLNIIQVNNDLADNDLEVNVLRGINLHVPSGYSSASLETYVIIEFPYPPETPQTARTRHGTGSTNAEYADSVHKFHIKRTDTKFKRLMTRKELKLSVFYKAGFLRSDRQLGTASVKLAGLDQTATIHESVDVFDSEHKKKPEGKLEVKIRIKEALGPAKASESLPHKWLVIDRFEEISNKSKPSTSKSPSTAPSITAISRLTSTSETLGLLAIILAGNNNNNNEVVDSSRPSVVVESDSGQRRDSQPPPTSSTGPQSIKVLKYEADLLQEQIEQLEDHLTPDQIDQLRIKYKAMKEQSDQIVDTLRQGGKQALDEYIRNLEGLIEHYDREADEFRQKNDRKKTDLFLTKKKLVREELEIMTDQSPDPPPTQF